MAASDISYPGFFQDRQHLSCRSGTLNQRHVLFPSDHKRYAYWGTLSLRQGFTGLICFGFRSWLYQYIKKLNYKEDVFQLFISIFANIIKSLIVNTNSSNKVDSVKFLSNSIPVVISVSYEITTFFFLVSTFFRQINKIIIFEALGYFNFKISSLTKNLTSNAF